MMMNGDMNVRVYTDAGQWIDVGTLEYLYQQFKARMMVELQATGMGALIDRDSQDIEG